MYIITQEWLIQIFPDFPEFGPKTALKMKVIGSRGGRVSIAPPTVFPEPIIVDLTTLTFNRSRDGVYYLQFWSQCSGWNAPGMLIYYHHCTVRNTFGLVNKNVMYIRVYQLANSLSISTFERTFRLLSMCGA